MMGDLSVHIYLLFCCFCCDVKMNENDSTNQAVYQRLVWGHHIHISVYLTVLACCLKGLFGVWLVSLFHLSFPFFNYQAPRYTYPCMIFMQSLLSTHDPINDFILQSDSCISLICTKETEVFMQQAVVRVYEF